jgi:V8-like Glu-specific endopeptidase
MFLDTADKDMETLKIRAMVKDATYYKFILTKADGFIYDSQSSALMGRTPADVVEYLKNPLNEEILVNLIKKVEKYWNQ